MEHAPFDYDQTKEGLLKSKIKLEDTFNKFKVLTDRSVALKRRIDEANGKDQEYLNTTAIELKGLVETTKALQLEVMEHMRQSIVDYEASIKRSAALSEKIKLAKTKLANNYKAKQLKLNAFLASSIGLLLIIGNQLGYNTTVLLGGIGILIFIVAIVSKYTHLNKSIYVELSTEIKEYEIEFEKLLKYQETLTAQNEQITSMLTQFEKGGEE